jgi:hypothetical protein
VLTKRYLTSTKNLKPILNKIVDGVAPTRFTIEHLSGIGFGSSGDRAIIPLLKDLGFLSADGRPTPRYHEFRDRSKSKPVMADALHDAFEDVFHISENPTSADRPAVEGLFKSKHNSTDKVAQLQAMTFYALLENADLKDRSSGEPSVPVSVQRPSMAESPEEGTKEGVGSFLSTELHY